MWINVLCWLTLLGSVHSQLSWNFNPDYKTTVFHAYVLEKKLQVHVYPALHVNLPKGARLCRLVLWPTESYAVPSFLTAEVTDAERGYGRILLNESALYAARVRGDAAVQDGMFHLKISAEDCGHPPKLTPPWTLNVILVPTDLPVWSQKHYTFNVSSTLPAGSIVGKVTGYAALDFDVDPADRLGDDTGMCAYAINNLLSGSSFDIDGHGVIRTRINFDPHQNARYELNVTGFDCHAPEQRRSTVSVTVLVRSDCLSDWTGLNHQFSYPILPTLQPVAPLASLNLCEAITNDCKLAEAVLRVKLLWTDRPLDRLQLDSINPEMTCDLDPLSLRLQRQLCGVSTKQLHELLPSDHVTMETVNFENNGYENSAVVHQFDGNTQWTITEAQLPLAEHRLDNVPFTLSFWMNHSSGSVRSDSVDEANGKEHIVCSADGQDKNRHHFAVFLHNCKLTVLLRREPVDEKQRELFQLYPSRWRFKIDEICDSQWHHYALVFKPPPEELVKGTLKESIHWRSDEQMKLYVDGDPITADPELVQIVEDLPLRKLHTPLEITRMSVGACWHSTLGRFVQHFSGQLVGLTLSRGITEPADVLQCLSNCNPRLHVTNPTAGHVKLTDFPALRQSQLDNLIIEVNHVPELAETLQKVVFFTPRLWHRPLERPEPSGVHINTVIRYKGQCPNVSIPDHTIKIIQPAPDKSTLAALMATPPHEPLTLNGTGSLNAPEVSHTLLLTVGERPQPTKVSGVDLQQGISLFPSLGLLWKRVSSHDVTWSLHPNGAVSFCDLGLCPIQSSAPYATALEPGEKLFINPQPGLHMEKFSSGIRLTGPAQVDTFVTTLRQVQWFDQSASFTARCFQVYCVAEFQSMDAGGSTNQLRIQSNTINTQFIVRPQSKHAPIIQRLHLRHSTSDDVAAGAQKHQASFPEPQTLRHLENLDLAVNPATTPWSYREQITYSLIGCGLAVLLGMVVFGSVTLIRLRGPRRLLPPGWKPSTRHASSIAARQAQPMVTIPRSSSLHVVVNPTSNPKEVEEMERKFCFYNRQVYAEGAEDTYDMENATDINEDISDFETPSNTLMDDSPNCVA